MRNEYITFETKSRIRPKLCYEEFHLEIMEEV